MKSWEGGRNVIIIKVMKVDVLEANMVLKGTKID